MTGSGTDNTFSAVLILGTAAVIQIKELFSGGTKMVRYTTG